MLDDFLQILVSLMHASGTIADVFIYAYGSQKILDSALEVFDYLEEIDKRYLVPIIISQKELVFDARIFSSSLGTLSVMLSRASSLITLLKSFV